MPPQQPPQQDGPSLAEIEAKQRQADLDQLMKRKAEIEQKLSQNEKNFKNQYGGTNEEPYPSQLYKVNEGPMATEAQNQQQASAQMQQYQQPHVEVGAQQIESQEMDQRAHEEMIKANEEASRREYLERMYAMQQQQQRQQEASANAQTQGQSQL